VTEDRRGKSESSRGEVGPVREEKRREEEEQVNWSGNGETTRVMLVYCFR
jgi:hypothetical protein